MRNVNMLLAICTGLLFLYGCSESYLSQEDELLPSQVQIPASLSAIPVANEGGILKFNSSKEYHTALKILDTTSLEIRRAWEASLGFRSVRFEFEELLDRFYNEESYSRSDYEGMVDFNYDFPKLINYSPFYASALNNEGLVIIGKMLGSVRNDGCFWSASQDKTALNAMIESRIADEDKGLFAFFPPKSMLEKSCTSGVSLSGITEYGEVTNGNGRGSTKLNGFFSYRYWAYTVSKTSTTVEIDISFDLGGNAQRKGRRKWKDHRQNHTFNWDFQVNHDVFVPGPGPFDRTRVSSTPMNFKGSETHFNVQRAVKYITVLAGTFPLGYNGRNDYPLFIVREGTSTGGTKHTTQDLTPVFLSHGCD
jgi:hypothetical protein